MEHPHLASELPADSFIKKIAEQRDNGFGFVPLIGAGLSAPSGVPIISEIKVYLHKCIALALGLDRLADPEDIYKRGRVPLEGLFRCRRWLPGRDRWPHFELTVSGDETRPNWSKRLGNAILESQQRGSRSLREFGVFQEAFGAAADWRSSLLFLSRLRLKHPDGTCSPEESPNELVLGAQAPDVIDTFFLQVIGGKHPTLGHRQLAMLAGPLRINTVLTTNFDDLLEQAFASVGNLLTVFDVHVDSGMPSYRDMYGLNAIVKLHGGRYGLRADYSLDDPPTDEDRRHFVEYLADRFIEEDEWERLRSGYDDSADSTPLARVRPRRHLLIIGCSANDARINALLRTAARVLDNDFCAFWVSYRKEDVTQAIALGKSIGGGFPARLFVLRHQFVGLLFLQLYQRIMASLPPSGSLFPTAPSLPVPPEFPQSTKNTIEFNSQKEALKEHITHVLEDTSALRLSLVSGPPDKLIGVLGVAAECFDELLDEGLQCVWIDLDEISSANELFEVIVQTVAEKTGANDWLPLLRQEDTPEQSIADAQVRELSRLTRRTGRTWVVFLNARSGPGANLIPEAMYDEARRAFPNGWLDVSRDSKPTGVRLAAYFGRDPTANGSAFKDLILNIDSNTCPNVIIVLLCFDGPLVNMLVADIRRPIHLTRVCLDNLPDPDTIVASALKWVGAEDAKARFLRAMCLANRSRYSTMLFSPAFWEASARNQPHVIESWLKELIDLHAIRPKRGGFVWMHCDVRNKLRKALRNNDHPNTGALAVADIHKLLADWYQSLFHACNDAAAAFDAAYHLCMEIAERLSLPGPLGTVTSRIKDALSSIRQLIEIMRGPALLSGFSAGICRRLEYLRDHLLAPNQRIVDKLKADSLDDNERQSVLSRIHGVIIASQELNRALAHELSENVTAFRRNRQWFASRRRFLKERSLQPDVAEWIGYELFKGMVGIAVRAYAFSRDTFDKIYNKCNFSTGAVDRSGATGDDAINPQKGGADSLAERCGAAEGHRLAEEAEAAFHVLAGLVRVLQRDQQLELAWGQSIHLRGGRIGDAKNRNAAHLKASEHFQRAMRCSDIALEVMRTLHKDPIRDADARRVVREEWTRWFDPRQRILTQAGLASSFLRDFEMAHRRLNEAQTLLNVAGHAGDSLERAIIELHRAEVLTQQAVFTASPNRGNDDTVFEEPMSPLGMMRRRVLALWWAPGSVLDANPSKATEAVIEQAKREMWWPSGEDIRGSLSFVDDAWQTLARAESLLKQKRKNVWWTTWFFELKMKLIELRLFGCLTSEIVPSLPYVGLEEAHFEMASIVDQLLDDAERMIRLDVFRAARIVECYVNSLIALVCWQQRALIGRDSRVHRPNTSDYAIALGHRVDVMRQRIGAAQRSLYIRLKRRLLLDEQPKSVRTELDDTVKEYAEFVLAFAEKARQITVFSGSEYLIGAP